MNWSTTTIGDISEFVRNGKSIKQDKNAGGLPITRIETIWNAEIDLERVGFADLTEGDVSDYLLQEGDILFSHINSLDHIGKCALYEGISTPLVHGMNLLCIRPKASIVHPRFLKYLFGQNDFRSKLLSVTNKSVNQASVSAGNLKKLPVRLPPLEQQKFIADVLDKADALRKKRLEALAKLDDLLKSVFLDMFGDPVTNPKGWKVGNIDFLAKHRSDVRCGPFGIQLKVSEIVDEGVPLFGIENVQDLQFVNETSKFLTCEKAKQLKAFSVENGDVLVTRMGTVGRACVVTGLEGEGRISYHLFRIRPDRSKCLPGFLAATISRSGTFQAQLERLAHGAIMSGLSTSNLKEIKFLLPPISLQERYENFAQQAEHAVKTQKVHLERFGSLFNSLQHHAFSGELSPNDTVELERLAV